MIIKRTEQSEKLAELISIPHNVLSGKIIEIGLNIGLFKDNSDYWQYSIQEHAEEEDISMDILLANFMPILNNSGYLGLLLKLITIGDGECPECGGDLEFFDYISKWNHSTGTEIVGGEYKCVVCKSITNHYDTDE